MVVAGAVSGRRSGEEVKEYKASVTQDGYILVTG